MGVGRGEGGTFIGMYRVSYHRFYALCPAADFICTNVSRCREFDLSKQLSGCDVAENLISSQPWDTSMWEVG